MIGRIDLVRFALRLLAWRPRRQLRTPKALRRRIERLNRLAPRPPRTVAYVATDAGGVKGERVVGPASRPDRYVLYLHGGGYIYGSAFLYRDFTWRIAAAGRAVVLCIDYRLAPEHPFPAALDDAVTAYRGLLAQGAEARHIVIAGDSAGGGLALATLMRLRDEGAPLPAAAVLISPWTDLALTGASLRRDPATDPLISVEAARRAARAYLAGADPRHPYASPLYGDPAGLPPTLILVGADELLEDDAVRMADKMRVAGCEVEIEVVPGLFHAWHLFSRVLREARATLGRVGTFLQARLD